MRSGDYKPDTGQVVSLFHSIMSHIVKNHDKNLVYYGTITS